MAVAKVIELLAQSEEGWEEAAQEALNEAKKSVRGIRNIYIKEMQATVENGEIVNYRVNAKVTFMVQS